MIRRLTSRGFDEEKLSAAILRLLEQQELVMTWNRQLRPYKEMAKSLKELESATGNLARLASRQTPGSIAIIQDQVAEAAKQWSSFADIAQVHRLANSIRALERSSRADSLVRIANEMATFTAKARGATAPVLVAGSEASTREKGKRSKSAVNAARKPAAKGSSSARAASGASKSATTRAAKKSGTSKKAGRSLKASATRGRTAHARGR